LKKFLGLVLALFFSSILEASPKYKSIEVLVPTAGTRVALSAVDLYSSHVLIKARSTNAGLVYVGGSDVAAANGLHLAANAELDLGALLRKDANEALNLKHVFIDSATNGDGVRVLYVFDRYKGSEPSQ
jgi:hypothetical protein